LNQESPGRAPRHGVTHPQHARPRGLVRLGSSRHGAIRTKLSRSSSSCRYSRTLLDLHALRRGILYTCRDSKINSQRWKCLHFFTAFSAPAHPPLKAWDNKLQGHFRLFKSSSTLFRRPLGPDTVRSPTSSGTSANGIGDQERAKVYHVHRRLASSAPPHCQRVLRPRRVDKSGP
jgi:hypothetical protein